MFMRLRPLVVAGFRLLCAKRRWWVRVTGRRLVAGEPVTPAGICCQPFSEHQLLSSSKLPINLQDLLRQRTVRAIASNIRRAETRTRCCARRAICRCR